MNHKKYYEAEGFNPEEFRFETWFDLASPNFVIEYEVVFAGMMIATRPKWVLDENGDRVLSHKGKALQLMREEGCGEFDGHCQHCGQQLRYCCMFYNTVNEEYIVVGNVCAENRMGLTLDQYLIDREQEKAQAAETKAWRAEEISKWMSEDETRQELIDFLGENASGDEFYWSLLRYFNNNGRLTEGQEEALRNSIAKRQEREERVDEYTNPAPVSDKRLTVRGKVLHTKVVESMYGYQHKMLVGEKGLYKIWSTIPSSIEADLHIGDVIQFDCKLQPSDDPCFVFASRPTKAEILHSEHTEPETP